VRGVTALDQETSGHLLEDVAGRTGVRQTTGQQEPQVLLLGEQGDGFLVGLGRYDHFGEDLDHLPGGGGVEAGIDGDNAAKGRDRITLEGPFIGGLEIRPQGDAAGIGVLDDGHSRRRLRIKLGDQFDGGVRVGDVVIAQRLALQLAGGGDAGAGIFLAVEGGGLVRVFPIAHGLDQGSGEGPAPGAVSPIAWANQAEMAAS